MMNKHLVIHPSGKLEWTELEHRARYYPPYDGERGYDIKDFYRIIGCSCFEQVTTIIPGIVILIDESGKLKNLPHNELASRLYAGFHYGVDDIVGTAIVFSLHRGGRYNEYDIYPLSDLDERKLSLCLGVPLPDK